MTRTKDNVFPATLDPIGLANAAMEMAKAGKLLEDTTEKEAMQCGEQVACRVMFLMRINEARE